MAPTLANQPTATVQLSVPVHAVSPCTVLVRLLSVYHGTSCAVAYVCVLFEDNVFDVADVSKFRVNKEPATVQVRTTWPGVGRRSPGTIQSENDG